MATRQAAKPGEDGSVRAATHVDAEFAAQFPSSFRVLWLIAVGIVGEAALAEDVVQEAVIIALGKRRQFQPGTNFTAWVGQIVRNVALNHARRERRRRSAPVAPADLERFSAEGRVGEGDDAPGRGDFDERLLRALGSVGSLPRACLLLRTLEGMEYSQISRLLDIPEGTAMSHVHRTRAYLRERLADLGQRERASEKGPDEK
jgi:RNA polymerase sigma-70 factor (ECF subfamily)